MRTTLTLDSDIADLLQRTARRDGLSFKRVVNDALRAGLKSQSQLPAQPRFQVQTFDSPFVPGVDPERLQALADTLEVEGFLEDSARDSA